MSPEQYAVGTDTIAGPFRPTCMPLDDSIESPPQQSRWPPPPPLFLARSWERRRTLLARCSPQIDRGPRGFSPFCLPRSASAGCSARSARTASSRSLFPARNQGRPLLSSLFFFSFFCARLYMNYKNQPPRGFSDVWWNHFELRPRSPFFFCTLGA